MNDVSSSVMAQSRILSRALSGVRTGQLAYMPSTEMLRMKPKVRVLEGLFHTACTHKGAQGVEISSGFRTGLHVVIVRCICLAVLLPRNRFILMSGSEKLTLLMKHSTSCRFALNFSELLVLVLQPNVQFLDLNRFLTSKNYRCTLKMRNGILQLPRIYSGLRRYWMETWNIHDTNADLFDETFALAGSCIMP